MAVPTLTLAGANINDGVSYTLLDNFDPGERVKTWSEYRSYSGKVAQYDVTEANLIEVSFRLKLQAATITALRQLVMWLNDIMTDYPACDLVYNDGSGAVTYHIVQSPRCRYVRTSWTHNKFWTTVDVTLYRLPEED